jgi:hypothetical protein
MQITQRRILDVEVAPVDRDNEKAKRRHHRRRRRDTTKPLNAVRALMAPMSPAS